MSNVRNFPTRKVRDRELEKTEDPLDFFRHPPRYPASQSVGGAVVGQVIVHPSSPDQSRKTPASAGTTGEPKKS